MNPWLRPSRPATTSTTSSPWGGHHLDFLRRFSEFHFGVPCERWLRSLVNRIDPVLFGRCFEDWTAALWPGRHDLIAKALHPLSAYASNARLTLAQLSVAEKTNEITAIPDLLDQLAEAKQLEGALVTIDAMGCQVAIADKIVAHKADYLLALRGNQPTLEGDVERYFADAPASELAAKTPVEKGPPCLDASLRFAGPHEAEGEAADGGHVLDAVGRIETRTCTASSTTDRIVSDRHYPGEPRFANISKKASWSPALLLEIFQLK